MPAPVHADPVPGGYAPPPPATPVVQSAGMEENVASALCYLVGWVTGVLFLVLEPYKNNRTVRFHAFQSIFFNIAIIPLYIVVGIFSFILHYIPVIGPLLIMVIYMVLGLGLFGMWIFLMYKAYNKEKFVIPFIGPLAEKQAGA
jgi:uncharacterized membrane protein